MSFDSMLSSVAIIKRPQAITAAWGASESFSELARRRCRIRLLSAAEQYSNGKTRADASHRIYITCGQAIRCSDVIEVDGIVYDITSVSSMGGTRLQIDARTHV